MIGLRRLAGLALLLTAGRLGAQGVRVTVHVTDTSRAPIADAEATLSRRSATVRHARTDTTGTAQLVAAPGGEYELVVRKLGYDSVTTKVSLRTADTTWTVEIELPRLALWLAPVVIKDKRLPREQQPYIAAAEIAASHRSIFSLADVIGKLRFRVDYKARKCLDPPRIAFFVPGDIPRARNIQVPRKAVVYVNGREAPREWDPWDSIHAEHIQEVLYVDCFDGSIPGLPKLSWPAVYVVLKPGYDWDPKQGSYAVEPQPPAAPRPPR